MKLLFTMQIIDLQHEGLKKGLIWSVIPLRDTLNNVLSIFYNYDIFIFY